MFFAVFFFLCVLLVDRKLSFAFIIKFTQSVTFLSLSRNNACILNIEYFLMCMFVIIITSYFGMRALDVLMLLKNIALMNFIASGVSDQVIHTVITAHYFYMGST